MEHTYKNTTALLSKAKNQIAEDMEGKGFCAILWDNSRADFHYIPEVTVNSHDGKNSVVRIMGLYLYDGELYLVEEDKAPVSMKDFYTEGVEVAPVVVTLTSDAARQSLGDPAVEKGYFTGGTLEEWLVVADCYFEALNER